jgi:hypothetical protein
MSVGCRSAIADRIDSTTCLCEVVGGFSSRGVPEPHFTGIRNGTGMPNSGPAGFRNPEFFGYATITFFLCLNYYFIFILFYRSTLIVCWFTCKIALPEFY